MKTSHIHVGLLLVAARISSWNCMRCSITGSPLPPSRSVSSTRVKPPRRTQTTRSRAVELLPQRDQAVGDRVSSLPLLVEGADSGEQALKVFRNVAGAFGCAAVDLSRFWLEADLGCDAVALGD